MPKKIVISKRAVLQRLNRWLPVNRKQLLVAGRGEMQGTYYLVSESGKVVAEGINSAELAQELGLLKPWEEVEK